MNLSNENKLLTYCLQTQIPEAILDEIRNLVGLSLDWEEILKSALWHGVAPLLYNNLKRIQKRRSIPQEVMDELRTAYNANLARNMYIYAELNSILGAFREKEVEVIVLKGAALAKTIYGDIGLRPMGDIDILVRKEDLPGAEKIMSGLGYLFQGNMPPEWYRKNHQHIVYIHPDKNIPVEIHWQIANKSHPFRIRNIDTDVIARWWKRAKTVKVSGKRILILCPDDLIFHLCLHFLKHRFIVIGHKAGFSSKGALIQLCDIFQILKHYRDKINWGRLKCEAEKYGVDSVIYTTLFIVRKIIGDHDNIFHDVLNGFPSESLDKEIVRLINKRVLIRENALPALAGSFIKSQVEDRFQKKVKIFLKQVFPHPEVLSKRYSVPLSSKMFYLYYLIHPLNLILKSGRIILEVQRIKEDVILKRWVSTKD